MTKATITALKRGSEMGDAVYSDADLLLYSRLMAQRRARLEKDQAEVGAQIERLETLLSSPFAEKAPAAVVQKEREKLAGYQETAAKLRAQLQALG